MIKNLNGTHETISYTTENGIQLYHNASLHSYPLHWHTGMEIILPYRNTYGATIGNDTFTFNEGDILLIPPGELHSLQAPSDFGERLIFQFDYSLLFNSTEMLSLLTLLRPYFVIKSESFPKLACLLAAYLKQIEAEYFNSSAFYETKICSLITEFFVALGRSSIALSDSIHDKDISCRNNLELFMSVCRYINDNFASELTLDDVAEHSGFSKSHFCRFFKRNAGMSYYDYLLQIRISNANILLQTPENSITYAALNSGFNSIATFNRVFKHFHNCSPSEYRSLHYKE